MEKVNSLSPCLGLFLKSQSISFMISISDVHINMYIYIYAYTPGLYVAILAHQTIWGVSDLPLNARMVVS